MVVSVVCPQIKQEYKIKNKVRINFMPFESVSCKNTPKKIGCEIANRSEGLSMMKIW